MAKIPTKAADLAALGKRIMTAWANNSDLTLRWITYTDAAAKVNAYDDLILQSSQSRNEDRSTARQLRDMDKVMDKQLDKLKKLIQLEHGKDNLSTLYAEYGIYQINGTYRLPLDRDDRLQSLRLMIAKLSTATFKNHTYGEAYWTDHLTQYEAHKVQLESQVSATSGHVGDKKELKTEVRQILSAIKKLIEANHPTSSETVLREWGFLDERN